MSKPAIGVVGATGVVGETFLLLMNEREFPFSTLRLFAGDSSKGLSRTVGGRAFEVQTLAEGCFEGLDIVFFSSGDDVSLEWAPKAVAAGAIAIDNSGAFRMDPNVLLCVPEVNGDLLSKIKSEIRTGRPRTHGQIIANPNCSTIQLVVALKPLADRYGIETVHVASYQSVSGAGKNGIEELLEQTKLAVEGEIPLLGKTFPKAIAFDSIPQIGSFSAESGFCTEEIKIMNESKKILRLGDLGVSAFTVRVPTLNAHAEAVWVKLKRGASSRAEIESCLASGAGIEVFSGTADYPTQSFASGRDPVYVGRVHRDSINPQTWMLWIVSDNLRKGAALNGIQIAEMIWPSPSRQELSVS